MFVYGVCHMHDRSIFYMRLETLRGLEGAMGIDRQQRKTRGRRNHALFDKRDARDGSTKYPPQKKRGAITSTFCRFAGCSKDSSTTRLVPACAGSAVSAWGPPVNLMLFGYTKKKDAEWSSGTWNYESGDHAKTRWNCLRDIKEKD